MKRFFDFSRGIGEGLGDLFGLFVCQFGVGNVVYELGNFFGVEGF